MKKDAKKTPINLRGPSQGMRTGYTTGACAAAAAAAAVRFWIHGEKPESINITIPNGDLVDFKIVRSEIHPNGASCVVIKDGGDDPDCTHGAEIIATVRPHIQDSLSIEGGTGVAQVTKPGLGLEVGTSAINPVPRQNISAMVRQELKDSCYDGADITITVPDGAERAKKTINERLGLIGGISILGTTGVVLPYSTSAFIASVVQSISLAAYADIKTLVFTTGGRSEQAAMKLRPDLGHEAFIQVGDYIGIAIRNTVRKSRDNIHIVAMMGKLSKIADGRMMTHASASEVNMNLLADFAQELGADQNVQQQIREANTARRS